MKKTHLLILTIIVLFLQNCTTSAPKIFNVNNKNIRYSGRIEKLNDEVILISSASSATAHFEGDTCVLYLRNYNMNGLYNYFSIELDNEDLGKFRIDGDEIMAIPVDITFQKEVHKISVYKSTEAANGYINFEGIECDKIVEPPIAPLKAIEFIGNSITCGMGNDTLKTPCHTNQWYDQHNAYWAYGPTVSRALEVNFMLSSVSGIGMYRNWNGIGPIMPEVYENLYLNTNASIKHDFSVFSPDIVSICMGTNDLSEGDGVNKRLPFDQVQFTNSYIQFVETILSHYPKTQIALLNSPMVAGEKNKILLNCLNKVKEYFENSTYKPFAIFEFEEITPHGCDYHPDINEHMQMAYQLYPFYKKLLDE